jgi:methyl-accepting chemotaxis protein
MQAASLAVRDIFEIGNEGEYHVDAQGELWKGTNLNISQSTGIVDHIKENTGMDVTIYWGGTRILTSIQNQQGERQTQSQAGSAIIQKVLQNGEYYFSRDIEILGKKYVACLITGLVKRIVNALNAGMGLLQKISEGDLTADADAALLNRKDEIGLLGKEILLMRDRLFEIVDMLRKKSVLLDQESDTLSKRSQAILTAMQDLERAAQEMSLSCTSQADNANIANSDVSAMGEMIDSNTMQVQHMHHISREIQLVSNQTADELKDLTDKMDMVRSSIHYLEQQTSLTKDSVDQIGSATDLIAAIASQTRLLSLNASIESARAGEMGNGFSVVASEIQKLSIQANKSVEDIRIMVESLTENSTKAMQRMAEVRTVIDNQEENIKKTGEIFETVTDNIHQSTNHIDNIMEHADELDTVRANMVASAQNSAAAAQENAASIQEIMASVASVYEELALITDKTKALGGLSSELKKSIGFFLSD